MRFVFPRNLTFSFEFLIVYYFFILIKESEINERSASELSSLSSQSFSNHNVTISRFSDNSEWSTLNQPRVQEAQEEVLGNLRSSTNSSRYTEGISSHLPRNSLDRTHPGDDSSNRPPFKLSSRINEMPIMTPIIEQELVDKSSEITLLDLVEDNKFFKKNNLSHSGSSGRSKKRQYVGAAVNSIKSSDEADRISTTSDSKRKYNGQENLRGKRSLTERKLDLDSGKTSISVRSQVQKFETLSKKSMQSGEGFNGFKQMSLKRKVAQEGADPSNLIEEFSRNQQNDEGV
jgi:hypothetical protein